MRFDPDEDSEKALKLLAQHGTGIEYTDAHPDGSVCLAQTQVADADLEHLVQCKEFVNLDLARTSTTDAGLAFVGKMRQLEYLRLYETGITDAGLASLGSLKNLCSLDVSAHPG